MGEPIKRDKQSVPVIKQYREQGRHGETYTAKRLPPGERRAEIFRVKRKYGPDET